MKTTPDKVLRVAKLHVRIYENRIDAANRGQRGINIRDCRHYLRIWKSIVAKNGENLTAEEVHEVTDAYESGEYDDIFTETN